MTWAKRRVAYIVGSPVGPQVIGWEDERHCGCMARRGKRLDNMEDTFIVSACDSHDQDVRLAHDAYVTMPPQDREVFELWENMLDQAIGDDDETVAPGDPADVEAGESREG